MVFIHVTDTATRQSVIQASLTHRLKFTDFACQGEQGLFAMGDEAPMILDSCGIAYEVVQEQALPQILTALGFEYYQRLKLHHPASLNFDTALPPSGCIAASITVDESLSRAAETILKSFGAINLQRSSGLRGDTETATRNVTSFTFILERDCRDKLVQALSEAGVACSSRESALWTECDPDK